MRYLATWMCLLLSGCLPHQDETVVTFFNKGEFPARLSEWGIVYVKAGELVVNKGVIPYDLNTSLFTDYAHKLRTVWLPPGSTATYDSLNDIKLPPGSIVSKTFYYPRQAGELLNVAKSDLQYSSHGLDMEQVRLIETRLLVHLESGWHGLPYVWNDSQTEAWLEVTGATAQLTLKDEQQFTYVVPDSNQCQECHVDNFTTGVMNLLGIKSRHINKNNSHFNKSKNQLVYWQEVGILPELPPAHTLPRNAIWDSPMDTLDHRARSYLDINCAHCHNPNGADTSALFLDISESDPLRLGMCKPPVAAGQGSGGRLFGIEPGNAEGSILTFRMQSLDLNAMMPELGRSTVHNQGVRLIGNWINALEGEC